MNTNYSVTRYTFDESRKVVWKAICEYLQKYIPENAVILELGSGYCDFINQIKAKGKYAVDINSEMSKYCDNDVDFIPSAVNKIHFADNSIDIIFASNLLEHLTDNELKETLSKITKVLRDGGKFILIQPNYYYCYREYWDDFTHVKAFSHISLCDFLASSGLKINKVEKRFLPFSFKSILPKSYLLTKLYLMFSWRPMAKQMLIIAEK